MPRRVSDVRSASGSLTRGAAGAVSARHRRKAFSADAEPYGTHSRRVAAARGASTSGVGPAAFGAAAGPSMKTGTRSNATDLRSVRLQPDRHGPPKGGHERVRRATGRAQLSAAFSVRHTPPSGASAQSPSALAVWADPERRLSPLHARRPSPASSRCPSS